MSETKTRKYRCNGCGEDRPCYLTTNQEPHTLDYMQIYDLKCVLDETNQTSYNWEEIETNVVQTSGSVCLIRKERAQSTGSEYCGKCIDEGKYINKH